jgi:hypothetical protein
MSPTPITPTVTASALLALLVAGCGGSSAKSVTTSRTPVAATTVSHAQAPSAHLRIISPRAGAHTGSTLTVRVRLRGISPTGPRAFVYVLDHQRARRAGSKLTFLNLRPGRHRLLVSFNDRARASAKVAFIVRAPAPTPAPAAAAAPIPTTTTAPPPTTAAPPPATTTTPPPSTTTTAPPPPPSTGIPQGNAGDRDGDNNGGPTDGDGNI